jgi:hypothetical protein
VDYVVAGWTETPSQPWPTLRFVEDAQKNLWVLDVAAERVADERHTLCGCGPPIGGAVVRRTIGYRAPQGRTFHGHVKVAVKEKRVILGWSGANLDGSICQQPP